MIALLFNKKKILLGLLILLNSIEVDAQNGFYVSKGVTVSFHFGSINEIQNGITYINFAEFVAYNQGDHVNGAIWDLTVRANAIFPNGLPLEVVEIWADIAPINGTSQGYQQLDNGLLAVNLILNGAIGDDMVIDISYRVGDIGNTEQMAGYPSDYYTVDLIFEIVFR
jgi:hypothetical protein